VDQLSVLSVQVPGAHSRDQFSFAPTSRRLRLPASERGCAMIHRSTFTPRTTKHGHHCPHQISDFVIAGIDRPARNSAGAQITTETASPFSEEHLVFRLECVRCAEQTGRRAEVEALTFFAYHLRFPGDLPVAHENFDTGS